jgi:hypothetical protein
VKSDNLEAISCGPGCVDGVHSWTYADPLTVDEEPWTYHVEAERPEAVIVWMAAALLLAVITALVVVAWRTVR